MKANNGTGDSELRALEGARVGEGEPPGRIVVAPWGLVRSTAGDFVVDEESGRLVIEAFSAHGTELPIDYEHQTLGGQYASPDGTAPAAGWIKALSVAPGEGIVAEVAWTDDAQRMLAAREYRYLSPVVVIRKSDRKLIGLHSAALTNKPAIVGMEPLVNGAVEPSVEADAALVALREALALGADAAPAEVLAVARTRIASLEDAAAAREAEEAVAQAQAAGKLAPAQRAWALRLAREHRAVFEEWARNAPVIVAPGRIAAPMASGGADTSGAAHARAEYRANRTLQALTSEEAYVRNAERRMQNRG